MKKSHLLKVMTLCMLVALLAMSCSELKNDLPAAATPASIAHSTGWTDTSSVNFHGKYIIAMAFDIRPCTQCHGNDYAGGTSGKSCLVCHQQIGGPENCATCHGMPPPPSIDGGNVSTAYGVGAHLIHWNGTGSHSSYAMMCEKCHQMPTTMYGATHINSTLRANVRFVDPLAALTAGGTTPLPVYSYDSLRCSNTFCHGSWRLTKSGLVSDSVYMDSVMTGNKYAPRWNGGTAEKACGTCHDNPPTGHKFYAQACSTCHEDITTTAGKLKHINGRIDLAGGIVRNFR